jgi:hypothetical protein
VGYLKKQTQFSIGQNGHKYLFEKGICENRMVFGNEKTKPIEANFGFMKAHYDVMNTIQVLFVV